MGRQSKAGGGGGGGGGWGWRWKPPVFWREIEPDFDSRTKYSFDNLIKMCRLYRSRYNKSTYPGVVLEVGITLLYIYNTIMLPHNYMNAMNN